MMQIDHDFTVWLSKSFGLFYLIGMSAAVLVYACWPSKRKQFDAAAKSILGNEDKPSKGEPWR
jgi:cytochrome c oxidase cbb3-type subunit 4